MSKHTAQTASETVGSGPFDVYASRYDMSFSDTILGRLLREQVWQRLAENYRQGDHILELGCGTGEDAIWLANRQIRVTATDQSASMLQRTRDKVARSQVRDLVQTAVIDLNRHPEWPGSNFDGSLANFGVLNCVADLSLLAKGLSAVLRPRARIVFVLMNRYCLWEVLWFSSHGDFATAARRITGSQKTAVLPGDTRVKVWYPTPKMVKKAFWPYCRVTRIQGLGMVLPPTYLQDLFVKHKQLLPKLSRIDTKITRLWPCSRLSDHYILEMEKCP